MADILTIATAGIRAEQTADKEHQLFPRVDYLELKRHIDMDVLDYAVYNNTPLGKGLHRIDTLLHSDVYLATVGLLKRNNYRLIFTMSERAEIPFAAFNRSIPQRKPLVTAFASWSARQEWVITRLGLFSALDEIIVQGSGIKQKLVSLGAAEDCINVIPYSVDHRFWAPMPDIEQEKGFIVSVGEVRGRDYPTLLKAVDGLPVNLLIAASGRWYAQQNHQDFEAETPSNVTIGSRFLRVELRKLYARMQFMVLSLHDGVPGGATATLEAMCMGRPVIASRTENICDYIIDGVTGILVKQGDAGELRDAIEYLVAHPEEAHRLGNNARQRIEDELNLDTYVDRIAQVLHRNLR